MTHESINVSLNGMPLIWLKEPDGTGALAPLEHIDEDGEVRIEHVSSDSYAHVCSDGFIRRYQQVIGHRDDLVVRGQDSTGSGAR